MLEIVVPASDDKWDEEKQEFVKGTDETTLILEHSLIGIYKWEAIYEKPFIGDGSDKYDKTAEEYMTYFKCMTVHPSDVSDDVYNALTKENVQEIIDYIASKQTATVITYLVEKRNNKPEIITAELIYCWMIMLNIPIKFERWHLNRLLTLIELVSLKSDPNPKKMSAAEYASWRQAENLKRRALRKAKH